MAENTKNQSTPQDEGSTEVQNVDPNQTQKKSPQEDTPNASEPKGESFTKEQVEALLKKTREDEKRKVYSRVEALTKEGEQTALQLKTLEAKLSEAQANLDNVRSGASSEVDSITKELQAMREQNAALSGQIEDVAKTAELRVKNSELKAYKEAAIRKSGLQLEELVSGDSEAEIDASIEAAKKRESAIKEKLREDARREVAADLPAPISPDGSQGLPGGAPGVSSTEIAAMARLSPAEFRKQKAALLEAAKKKAGWG